LDHITEKYFQIIGVSKHASIEEMKQAYKDLAKVWHPDRFIENPRLQKKANEKLKEINIAYEKLLSFYESKNSFLATCVYSDTTQKESLEEEPRTVPIDEIKQISKGYRFLVWMASIFAMVILTIIVLIYSDFKNKKSDPYMPPAILMPDHANLPEPAETDSSSIKPPIRNKYSGKTNDVNSLKKNLLKRKEYFTLGSTTDDVLATQGTPTHISGNRWNYGFSYVDFEGGRVARWYNSKLEPLNIRMLPSKEPEVRREYFTLGSTTDDVLATQGTPTHISGNRWNYGFSYVDFEGGQVARWYNSKEDPLLVEHEP